jgi:hypothetical protein
LSSENPTIEFSSEFKKVIIQHSGTNSTVIRIKFGFYKKTSQDISKTVFVSAKKQMLLFSILSLSLSSRFPDM